MQHLQVRVRAAEEALEVDRLRAEGLADGPRSQRLDAEAEEADEDLVIVWGEQRVTVVDVG